MKLRILDFHAFLDVPCQTLHTLFTHFELVWPNKSQLVDIGFLKECTVAGESKFGINRGFFPLTRVKGPQKRGKRPPKSAIGPRQPLTRARVMYFSHMYKVKKSTIIFLT